jgi:predicted Holliday junction resolvase-like endonuclease
MVDKIQTLISELKSSNLWAESPCGDEFKISDCILFDGTKPFPKEALEAQLEYMQEIKDREKALEKLKKLTTEKAVITTRAVNIGQSLEKVLPTMKDFNWPLPDCRFLGNPIDMIVFKGYSKSKIDYLNFIEVKSGAARLNSNQKIVKEAIEKNKVSWKEFK